MDEPSEDLYGLTGYSLESARIAVERALGIEMEPHDSYYHGGDYYLGHKGDDEIILQRNLEVGDTAEEEFADVPMLLYVSSGRSEAAEEIERQLVTQVPGISLLRRQRWDSTTGSYRR